MITVLIAGIFGFLISLTALPVFIKKMKSLKLGQLIREEGPAAHQHKAGTPTMAGSDFHPRGDSRLLLDPGGERSALRYRAGTDCYRVADHRLHPGHARCGRGGRHHEVP